MLTVSFSQVKYNQDPLKKIDEDVELRPEFFERGKDLVIEVNNVHAKGQLFYQEPYVIGDFDVEADVVAPSSRSLKPVKLHEKFHFTENYSLKEPTQQELDDNGGMIVKVKNDEIDLQTAIEDNILLHIPTTLLTDDESKGEFPEGQGWNVISQDKYEEMQDKKINPAFASLKSLLSDNIDKDKK